MLQDIIVQKHNFLFIEVETKFEYNRKVHEQSFSNLNGVVWLITTKREQSTLISSPVSGTATSAQWPFQRYLVANNSGQSRQPLVCACSQHTIVWTMQTSQVGPSSTQEIILKQCSFILPTNICTHYANPGHLKYFLTTLTFLQLFFHEISRDWIPDFRQAVWPKFLL